MNDTIEQLIRHALIDLAEQAPPVSGQVPAALRRSARRRSRRLLVTVVGFATALLIGTPVAFAAMDHLRSPAVPATPNPSPSAPADTPSVPSRPPSTPVFSPPAPPSGFSSSAPSSAGSSAGSSSGAHPSGGASG